MKHDEVIFNLFIMAYMGWYLPEIEKSYQSLISEGYYIGWRTCFLNHIEE